MRVFVIMWCGMDLETPNFLEAFRKLMEYVFLCVDQWEGVLMVGCIIGLVSRLVA